MFFWYSLQKQVPTLYQQFKKKSNNFWKFYALNESIDIRNYATLIYTLRIDSKKNLYFKRQ